jgi:hypothetical protein
MTTNTMQQLSLLKRLRKWGAILAAATVIATSLEQLLVVLDPIISPVIGVITGFYA